MNTSHYRKWKVKCHITVYYTIISHHTLHFVVTSEAIPATGLKKLNKTTKA